MKDKFIRQEFDMVFNVENVVTIFYMEFSKDFYYEGESHDFWEMVYIDKGEMLCTANKKKFTLKGGELTFHKPNEFHNLSSNKSTAPNVSIITFVCSSPAMSYFEGKIFKLTEKEKSFLSMLFEEGLSAYSLLDNKNPLVQKLIKREDAPFGSSQMTKNLLEAFLIKLSRYKDNLDKEERAQFKFHGTEVPYELKEVLTTLEENIYGTITVEQLANKVNKSSSTIKNIFNRHIGGGIIKYYNKLKINESKKLIREGKYNISQISEMLGFDTPQYFSICFKKATKMSPTEYKNSIMK